MKSNLKKKSAQSPLINETSIQDRINYFFEKLEQNQLTTLKQFRKEFEALNSYLTSLSIKEIFQQVVIPAFNLHYKLGEDPLTKIKAAIKIISNSRIASHHNSLTPVFNTAENLLIAANKNKTLYNVILTSLEETFKGDGFSRIDIFNVLYGEEQNNPDVSNKERAELLLNLAQHLIDERTPINFFPVYDHGIMRSIFSVTVPELESNDSNTKIYSSILMHQSFTNLDPISQIHVYHKIAWLEINKTCNILNTDNKYQKDFVLALLFKMQDQLDLLKSQNYHTGFTSASYQDMKDKIEYCSNTFYSIYFETNNHLLHDQDDNIAGQKLLSDWPHHALEALENKEHSSHTIRQLFLFINFISTRFSLDHTKITTNFILDNYSSLLLNPEIRTYIKENADILINLNTIAEKAANTENDRDIRNLKALISFCWKDSPAAWEYKIEEVTSIKNIKKLIDLTVGNEKLSLSLECSYKIIRALLETNTSININDRINIFIKDYDNVENLAPTFAKDYAFLIYLRDNYTTDGILDTTTISDLATLDQTFIHSFVQTNNLRGFLEVITAHHDNNELIDTVCNDLAQNNETAHYAFIAQYVILNIELYNENKGYLIHNLTLNILNDSALDDTAKTIILKTLHDNQYYGKVEGSESKNLTELTKIAKGFCNIYSKELLNKSSDSEEEANQISETSTKSKTEQNRKKNQKKKLKQLEQNILTELTTKLVNIDNLTENDRAMLSHINSDNINILPSYFIQTAKAPKVPIKHMLACYEAALMISESAIKLYQKQISATDNTELTGKILGLLETIDIIKQDLLLINAAANKIESLSKFHQIKKAQKQENAAIKIQSAFRGLQAKQEVHDRRGKRHSAIESFYQSTLKTATENVYSFKTQQREQPLMAAEDQLSHDALNDRIFALTEMIRVQRAQLKSQQEEIQKLREEAQIAQQNFSEQQNRSSELYHELQNHRSQIIELENKILEQAEYIRKGEAVFRQIKEYAQTIVQPSLADNQRQLVANQREIVQLKDALVQSRRQANKVILREQNTSRHNHNLQQQILLRDAEIQKLTQFLRNEIAKNQCLIHDYEMAKQAIHNLQLTISDIKQHEQLHLAGLGQEIASLQNRINGQRDIIDSLEEANSINAILRDSQPFEYKRNIVKRQMDAIEQIYQAMIDAGINVEKVIEIKAEYDAAINHFNPCLTIGQKAYVTDGYLEHFEKAQSELSSKSTSPTSSIKATNSDSDLEHTDSEKDTPAKWQNSITSENSAMLTVPSGVN